MGTLNNKNVLVQGLPQKQNGQRDMNSEQYTKVKEDAELAKLRELSTTRFDNPIVWYHMTV